AAGRADLRPGRAGGGRLLGRHPPPPRADRRRKRAEGDPRVDRGARPGRPLPGADRLRRSAGEGGAGRAGQTGQPVSARGRRRGDEGRVQRGIARLERTALGGHPPRRAACRRGRGAGRASRAPAVTAPHVLRDYAFIADGERGALIGPEGDVAWMCFPAWDSDAVFSELVGGSVTYAVRPAGRCVWGGYYERG